MRPMIEHVGFAEEHGELVGTCEFPHDEVLDRLDGTASPDATPEHEAMQLAGDGLRELLHWVWRKGTARASPITAFRRFMVLSATLRPELLDDMTLSQLGQEAGCTKANLSKAALKFTTQFGLEFRRQRTPTSRAHMRTAMLASHEKRKNENTSPTPTP